MLYSGLSETNFEILSNRLLIEGSHSKEIPFNEIRNVDLVDNLPSIIKKSNGIEFGQNMIGYFLTKDCKTYLNVNLKNPPFLIIITINETIYLSNVNSNIESVYNKILDNVK